MLNVVIADNEFNLFKDLIYSIAGISLAPTKKPLVSSRLASRLRYFEFDSYLDYYKHVTGPNEDGEKQIMVDLLTTNETSFFRESDHFDFLVDKILSAHDKSQKFRVWSAACSSGEEPYTIGMVLKEYLKNDHWEIMGSDISSRILEKSNKATYPIDKTKQIPEKYLKKYCLKGVKSHEGFFKISKEIKKNISFHSVNLIEPLPDFGVFNLIFIRNVMIYFDNPTRKLIVENMHEKIAKGGYLFIGHSETLFGITDKFKMVKPATYIKV